ncbi:MAG: TlpA disulfide reductase family protein [Planctomycetota bacterium]
MRLVILDASIQIRWLACCLLGFGLGADSSAFTIPADCLQSLCKEWSTFKQQYWTAMNACGKARVAYCEPYYEWLEARGLKHSDQVFTEYQKDHGPCPPDITPEWIPQFEQRLVDARDPSLVADMTWNLLIIYGNQRMKNEWLALYLEFVESQPQSPIVGRNAESALYNAGEQGREDQVAGVLAGIADVAGSSNARLIRLALARRLESRGEHESALASYQEIVRDYRGSEEARDANGALYELSRLAVGKPAPDFTARDLSGVEVNLASLRGRVVFIEFWSTHCGPCKGEIPTLKELHRKFGGSDLQVLGVSLDSDAKALKQFLTKQKMEWPQICDFKEFQGDLARTYHVRYIPRSILIDREGNIAQKDLRGEKVIKAVSKLLEEKKGAPAATLGFQMKR